MTTIGQVVPSATAVFVEKSGKSVVTQTGGTYKTGGYVAMDGTGGMYLQDASTSSAGQLAGGVQVKMVVSFPALPDGDGCLLTRIGTLAIGLSGGKFKTGWVKGANDPYNASTDQINGLQALEINKKYALDWSYDAGTGMVVMMVNGMLDRKRYRFFGKGEIGNDGASAWQFFKGLKVNVYSVLLAVGKPNLVAPGLECYAVGESLIFRHIDPTLVNAEVRMVRENPFGALVTLPVYKLTSAESQAVAVPLPKDIQGVYTLHLFANLNGKTLWSDVKLMTSLAAVPAVPAMVKGVYHVKPEDFAAVKGLGATHLFCDFTINAMPGGKLNLPTFMEKANLAGLKLMAAGNFQAQKTSPFPIAGNHPAMAGWYAVDEAQGNFKKFGENYRGQRALYPTVPVVVDLNNFTRIEEAAECADILMVNVYLSNATQDRRKITDVVTKAAALRPTWLVLPLYQTIQTSTEDLVEMTRLGLAAGAKGIWIFEWDHRTPNTPNDWYVGDKPEMMERVRAVFASV